MTAHINEQGRPVGHDGKAISERAWERAHAVIARIEAKANIRLANEQKGA
ncbi:hypothetical protein MHI37_06850 [Paenibacillus sp. FSL H8-0548]|nr:hypothetical protein [Paenibacillus sp. FSL H8-0548]